MKKTISWGDEQGFQIGVRSRGGCCSQKKGQGLVFDRLENTIKKKIRFEFCSCLLPSMHPRHTRHAHCPGPTKTRALTLTAAAQADGTSVSCSKIRAVQRATCRNHRNQEGTETSSHSTTLAFQTKAVDSDPAEQPPALAASSWGEENEAQPQGSYLLEEEGRGAMPNPVRSVCFWCQGVSTLGLFSPWAHGC